MASHRQSHQQPCSVRTATRAKPKRSAASAPHLARRSGAAIPAWNRSNGLNATKLFGAELSGFPAECREDIALEVQLTCSSAALENDCRHCCSIVPSRSAAPEREQMPEIIDA